MRESPQRTMDVMYRNELALASELVYRTDALNVVSTPVTDVTLSPLQVQAPRPAIENPPPPKPMAHRHTFLFCALIAALLLPAQAMRAQAGANVDMRLAFSFSDVPSPGGKLYSGKEQTQRLLEDLKKGNIHEAAFYVNPASLLQGDGMERVKAYAAAGHRIGLFVPVSPATGAEFIEQFKKGHEAVSKLPNFFPSVRYPEAKDPKQDIIPADVQAALTAAGYTIGYYTVSAGDARMNGMLQRAIEEKKPINWDYMRDVYLRLHVESLQFYDQLTDVVSNNRAKSHILLLHENDLTAKHMLGLIVQCRRMGIETIKVSEALKDPLADIMPKQSPQARPVGLALDRQGARATVPERATDEGMDKMVEFFNVFNGKK
jgi:hypothetical protein